MNVNIEKRAQKYIKSLPKKDRNLIKAHLRRLNNLYSNHNVELMMSGHCWMPIAKRFTNEFPRHTITILTVMTIEEAQKRYKRFGR